ncbi:MAG: sulfur carrier protein ThiS [Myxococcales bacterium]|nr:sulfur carrier protein ThiS [Myxococcales bacterium]
MTGISDPVGGDVNLVEIRLNGESRRLAAGSTVEDLVQALDLRGRRIAVERNREIVPRSAYPAVVLESGDALEIVHFVGGG